jgi:enoyl-CoA hydratase
MEIISEIHGNTAWISLNRPQALNALSLPMIRELRDLLIDWENTHSIQAVFIQGAGEKAFCAGGDIRYLYEAMQKDDLKTCEHYFKEEYALNAQIYTYKKPIAALIDGITMGGGMGISMTGSYRIVTERALLAMPETGIGLFPDAGGTTFLKDTPGVTGLYLGLTGYRLTHEDALWSGLGTHYMPVTGLSLFKSDVMGGMPLEEALSRYSQVPLKKGFLEDHQDEIETHFNRPTLKEIFQSLASTSSSFAQNTYKILRSKSPTSLAVTFKQLKEVGPSLSFSGRMEMEFKLSQHFVKGHDFREGIRAVIIDKDQLPRWIPAQVEDILQPDIDNYFSNGS